MFSKSLFKQSVKANGMMWLIITVAVCFTLSCVMLISGRGSIGETKEAIQDTIIKGELTSSIKEKGVGYYEIGQSAMAYFDESFAKNYGATVQKLMGAGMSQEEATQKATLSAYAVACEDLQTEYYPALLKEQNLTDDSDEGQELKGIIFYILNPMQEDGTYMFDDFYTENGEAPFHYTDYLASIGSETHTDEREKYVMNTCSAFLAGNMIKEENIEKVVNALTDYGVTIDQYKEYGMADYATVRDTAKSAIVSYRADTEFRLDNQKGGENTEDIKAEVKKNVCGSFLSKLPEEVSNALDEIGSMDMYGTLVGTIFFKMAGLLLPIIYLIMTANALIAGQVDSGSMAYVLSTSVKRRSVTFTQSVYLIGSLLLMFVCSAATSIVCLNIVDVETSLTWQKLLLINAGSFLVMFAMSGLCFLTSCWFDRSKRAMALGGGISMASLVATMLGLFGTNIMPSILRMKALNYFNYVSVITLFDSTSILDGTTTYLWKFAILFGIGFVCYLIGAIRFRKKDLPL